MTHRPGITLVEVLVAILITAVGLLSLLVLFPLGALEMAQAIKDDRTGHVKHNAAAFASISWPDSSSITGAACTLRTDPDVINAMLNPYGLSTPMAPNPYPAGAPLAPYPNAPTINYYSQSTPGGPVTLNPAMSGQPSYPVIVDPNGYWANQPGSYLAWQSWVGGGPTAIDPTTGQPFMLPRRVYCEPFKTNSQGGAILANAGGYRRQRLLQWTTLLDDMRFPRDVDFAGRPCQLGANTVDRVPRYSWAYLCRMNQAGVGTNIPVNVSVIVYSGRALDQATSGETAFTANFGPIGSSLVTLTWNAGQDPPDVTVGGWIFDATMSQPPHGFFYRVVSINRTSPTSMDVEVQTPLQATASPGTVVIMDNVVEVFDLKTF